MLAHCEFMLDYMVNMSERATKNELSDGQTARAKANCSRLAREVVALAREVCGGNGILLEHQVMKHFNDFEGMYTFEGTYDINTLVSGRELTGGLSAVR